MYMETKRRVRRIVVRGDRGKVTKLGVKDEGYSVIEKRGSGGKLSEIWVTSISNTNIHELNENEKKHKRKNWKHVNIAI